MMRAMVRTAGCATALCGVCALSACGSSDFASYLIDGTADHALTLIRDKAYLWSDGWDLDLVVTSQPDCQRRHALKRSGDGNFKLNVYRSAEGAYILKQGKRWYVTELHSCRLQQYEEAPPAPGDLIGSFETRGGPLHFSPATAESKATAEESTPESPPAAPR
jgi:hypothetical protein